MCDALGLEKVSQAVASLEDDEKGVSNIATPGGEQSMLTVNESGLYTIVLKSRKPEAVAFKRWVTREVLPSIRKTGGYLSGKQRVSFIGLAETVADVNAQLQSHAAQLRELTVRTLPAPPPPVGYLPPKAVTPPLTAGRGEVPERTLFAARDCGYG